MSGIKDMFDDIKDKVEDVVDDVFDKGTDKVKDVAEKVVGDNSAVKGAIDLGSLKAEKAVGNVIDNLDLGDILNKNKDKDKK